METLLADNDYCARAARIEEIRAIGDQITELSGHINAATYRLLTLIAEFDRRAGWNDGGTQSCAHWLNWKCGISFCAAREKVRTARALENLPKISAAMERGELSYSKVRERQLLNSCRRGPGARMRWNCWPRVSLKTAPRR